MKKLLCILLSSSMVLAFNTTAFAEETTETPTVDKNSSTWLESQLEGTFSDLEFQLADVPDSSVALNLQYARLQSSIIENGYGEDYSITLPDSVSISGNASDLFEQEFGDIDFSLEKVEIPEDFNVDSILNESKALVNQEYGNFVNSEGFKEIYGNISTYKENNDIKSSLSFNNVINMVDGADLNSLISSVNNREEKKGEYQSKANNNKGEYENYTNPYASEMEETKDLIDMLANKAYEQNGSAVSVMTNAETLASLKEITKSSLNNQGWEERLQSMFDIFNENTKEVADDLDEDLVSVAANQMSLSEVKTYLNRLGQDADSYSLEELEAAKIQLAKIAGASASYNGEKHILESKGREYLINVVAEAFEYETTIDMSDYTLEELYVMFKYNTYNDAYVD